MVKEEEEWGRCCKAYRIADNSDVKTLDSVGNLTWKERVGNRTANPVPDVVLEPSV